MKYGQLAFDIDGQKYLLQILKSAAGFYIGTADRGEPVSRESQEYFRTRQAAEKSLSDGSWTQRLHL